MVLGVEMMAAVALLARQCAEDNGQAAAVRVAKADAFTMPPEAVVRRRAGGETEGASLLVAELMDSGGLGEAMLPLAARAVRDGLVRRDAAFVPRRLRVWAMGVELRSCGTVRRSTWTDGATPSLHLHLHLHHQHQHHHDHQHLSSTTITGTIARAAALTVPAQPSSPSPPS